MRPLPHILPITCLATLLISMLACASSPAPAPDTAPLRSGDATAKEVGDRSRKAIAANPAQPYQLVRYAASIDNDASRKDNPKTAPAQPTDDTPPVNTAPDAQDATPPASAPPAEATSTP